VALQIVLDTNLFVSALRSRQGASYEILRLTGQDAGFEINLSVPLVLEYESVAKRVVDELNMTAQEVDDIIGYLCEVAVQHKIHYLWRPVLPDPKDDMVLEVAVAGQCEYIVTHNVKDFQGAEHFGMKIITPHNFLMILGG
jgi:putative PIN family toxin of toxin-antitoxin system